MSKKDFEDMLNKYSSESGEDEIDWKAQKKEWLYFIKQFYDSVELWLKPYVDKNKIKYKYENIELVEDYIGFYNTKIMTISFANQQIKLKPIGTLLIGTKGRIDMDGVRGKVQFILADKNSKGVKISIINGDLAKRKELLRPPEWTWKIVLRESRKISYEDFNENNFFDSLMEVTNGSH